jgi:hypothetical protein
MKPISTLIAIILIIVSNVANAQSFVAINNTIDNFVASSNNDNAVYPYNTACDQKQIQKTFSSAAVLGGAREIHFNGFADGCSDNKVKVDNGALNIMMNDGGAQWITTNLMYDATKTESASLNTTGLNLDLKSNNVKNAIFSLDFFNISASNDIFVKLVLYSGDNAFSEIPAKLSGNNFNTTLVFNTDSLRKHSAAFYPVNLNKVGAIRIMIRTKGNATLSVKNFNLGTLQNKAFVGTVLQNTQYLNQSSFSWVNNTNDNTIASQTLEASADAVNFIVITATNNTAYLYTDKLQAYTNYRIKTVDGYGRVTYSNVVKTAKLVLEADIKVFPTVVTTTTTVLINSQEVGEMALQLINTNGQIFLTKSLNISKGINTFVILIPSTTSGALWISLLNKKNNTTNSFKILKQL